MSRGDRDLRFDKQMSDAEALMWNVEKDPWLNPSGGMITILDRPLDIAQFRRRMISAIAKIPRLRERVVPGFGRLAPPEWATDPEFDLDYHLRHISLPGPGDERQLFDLSTRLYEDPYDRTRPLWMFVVIDGLEGGRGAIFTKLHHSISDGIGAVRMSELYIERKRKAPLPDEVDLGSIIAEAAAKEAGEERAPLAATPAGPLVKTGGHVWRRQAGIARRALGEMSTWAADPMQPRDLAGDLANTAKSLLGQMNRREEGVAGGAPLWANRSRRRHLEALQVPLDDVKAAGKALGASINDVFVAGAVLGAIDYHAKRGTEVEALNISFVVSTRTDAAIGGNSFTPTLLQVPGRVNDPEHVLHEVRDRMATKRESVTGEGGLSGLAGLANLLPTSVVTHVARSQAAKMDFATSNLRGAPFATFMSGAQVMQNVLMGPVAGTACNITTLSYNGNLDIGMFLDPAAIEDPADFRECVERGYRDLIAAGQR